MTTEEWNIEIFSLLNQYVYSGMSKQELRKKFTLLADNQPIETLCTSCNQIFTDSIFRRKDDSSSGLCFDCY